MIIPEEHRSMMIRGFIIGTERNDLIYKIAKFLSTGDTSDLTNPPTSEAFLAVHCSICGTEDPRQTTKTCSVCQMSDNYLIGSIGFIPVCDCGEDMYVDASGVLAVSSHCSCEEDDEDEDDEDEDEDNDILAEADKLIEQEKAEEKIVTDVENEVAELRKKKSNAKP